MKRYNTDDLIVPQEESPLHDSHVTEYKRHNGIHDSHVECYERFKSSLHDSHVERYFEHLAETKKPSSFKKGKGIRGWII
jgi:hypothetical protein